MFLLVPAHPGFPGQIPQRRKTVVCVCVSNKHMNDIVRHVAPLYVSQIYDCISPSATTSEDVHESRYYSSPCDVICSKLSSGSVCIIHIQWTYRGIKLLEHAMEVVERIFEDRIRQQIDIDDMQFGFMKGDSPCDSSCVASRGSYLHEA